MGLQRCPRAAGLAFPDRIAAKHQRRQQESACHRCGEHIVVTAKMIVDQPDDQRPKPAAQRNQARHEAEDHTEAEYPGVPAGHVGADKHLGGRGMADDGGDRQRHGADAVEQQSAANGPTGERHRADQSGIDLGDQFLARLGYSARRNSWASAPRYPRSARWRRRPCASRRRRSAPGRATTQRSARAHVL